MATKSELEAKIKKAEANSMMPAELKKAYIEKIEKEIKALDTGNSTPVKKASPAPSSKKKKSSPKKKAKVQKEKSSTEEKSCAELRSDWNKRREASKNRKVKTPYSSSTSAIENAVDSIEKKYKEKELSKAEIEKIIATLHEEIQYLKDLLTKTQK